MCPSLNTGMSWIEFLVLTSILVNPVSSKSVSATSEGTESEEEEKAVSKSQHKCDKKISTQSSQIKDLWVKLDGVIAENMQIRELLNPANTANCVHKCPTSFRTVQN